MNCPRCGYKVDQDFGVFTCPQCQAVLFIDLDGNVQVSEPNSAGEISSPQASQDFPEMPVNSGASPSLGDSGAVASENSLQSKVTPSIQAEAGTGNPRKIPQPIPKPIPPKSPIQVPTAPRPPTPLNQTTQSLGASSGQQTNPFLPPQLAEKLAQAGLPGFPAKVARVQTNAPPVAKKSAPAAVATRPKISLQDLAKEISDLANDNEAPQLLSYEIQIEGIDTSELRQKILDALSDNRFRWEARVLLSQIKNGQLSLPRLNPAKAMVMIRRLQALPVRITWIQFRL